jgi:catechol 2,3-dioxygenase-like lactoylglutathione lyase family enzyme
MTKRPKLSFSHMGIFVSDINKMVDFYTRVLGLVVSDRGIVQDGRDMAFMTLDPREHHQVALTTSGDAQTSH